MSGRDRRRRVLSRDEREMWTRATKAVAPLRTPAAKKPDGEVAAAERKPAARLSPSKSGDKNPAASPRQPATPPPPPILTPLGRRLKQRIGRGKEAIDGRLDLHGLTQSEAHAALLRFLRGASGGDKKLVLVITGKSGVLRRQVPLWLGLPEFHQYVIGFEGAHIAHGGEGALYVRVRRGR